MVSPVRANRSCGKLGEEAQSVVGTAIYGTVSPILPVKVYKIARKWLQKTILPQVQIDI